jgi:hypothetical protein
MTRTLSSLPTRRHLLAIGLGVGAALAGAATAQAKTPRSAVGFQTHPNGTSACATCTSFIPATDPAQPGSCKIVEGEIPPTSWCALYARRSA